MAWPGAFVASPDASFGASTVAWPAAMARQTAAGSIEFRHTALGAPRVTVDSLPNR